MIKLYKRGNVYWCSVTTNGRRLRFSTKCVDKVSAEERAWNIASNRNILQTSQSINLRWSHAVNKYLAEITYKCTKEQLGDKSKLSWVSAQIGNPLLSDITKAQLMSIIDIKRTKNGISTANRYISVINSVLGRAFNEWGWLRSPLKLKCSKEKIKAFKWITKKEASILTSKCPIWLKPIVCMALKTGLRRSNIFNIKWEDVSLENKVMWVNSKDSKSGKAVRVPLDEVALIVLRTQARYKATRMGYIFDRDHLLTKRMWDDVCKQANLPGLRFHDLRHTFASWKVQSGVPIYEVMKLMGHSDIKSTLRYAHLEPNL